MGAAISNVPLRARSDLEVVEGRGIPIKEMTGAGRFELPSEGPKPSSLVQASLRARAQKKAPSLYPYGHDWPMCLRYVAGSMRPFVSLAFATSSTAIHPSPYGDLFTSSGLSSSALLTSTTLPETGA